MSSDIAASEVVLKLKTPLKTTEGKEISELTLKEPTAGQLAAAEQFAGKKGNNEMTLQLISFSCGVHINILKNLAASDYHKAAEAIGSFFENGRETGETSLQN